MRKVEGSLPVKPIECINPLKNKWVIRWGIIPDPENPESVTFMEVSFAYKPAIEEIKKIILSRYNEQIENEIKTGFVWNKKSVWLSAENQSNFRMFYETAVQTEGENIPLKIKIGEDEAGEPVYHSFQSPETYSDFIKAMNKHVQTTLQNGWKVKDGIDWGEYEVSVP